MKLKRAGNILTLARATEGERTMKKCSDCKKFKELIEFSKDKSKKDELQCICKSCRSLKKDNPKYGEKYYDKNRSKIASCYQQNKEFIKTNNQKSPTFKIRSIKSGRVRTLKHFGLTLADYDRMFDAQKGCCKICDKHQSQLNKRLAVDHCHQTGKIRGLLCNSCNRALGLFGDNKDNLKAALDYLS